MEQKRYRRRQYLVDKRLQTGFTLGLLSILAFMVVLSGISTYLLLSREIEAYLFSPHLPSKSIAELIRDTLLWVNGGFFLATTAATLAITVIHANRLSGSLKRFIAHLSTLTTGRLQGPIYFRRRDPLLETAKTFNQAIDGLRNRFMEADLKLEDAIEAISRAEEAMESSSENKETLMQELQKASDLLRAADMTLPGSGGRKV